MIPYTRIVVGTDGSSLAGPTVARAAWLAAREEADLVIVCAFTAMPRRADAMNVFTLGGDPKIDQVPGEASAGQALQEAVSIAKEQGARVVAALLVDADAATALLQEVNERQADLLVIGAIRDRSVASRVLGTVASQVVREATCEVLIVRPGAGEPAPSPAEDAPEHSG